LTKICQKCKTKNLDEAKYCEKCGNDLSEVLTIPSPEKKNKLDFLRRNWIAAILGLIIGLFLALITITYANLVSVFIILPIASGVSSVYLANNTEYLEGTMTGILSIIILGIITLTFGIGIIFILVAALGGFLGVILNKYIFKSENIGDDKKASRIVGIQNWWDNRRNGIRILSLLAITILGIALFAGIIAISTGQMST